MSAPAVNVVASFDPESMIAFQRLGSLKQFRDYVTAKKNTLKADFTSIFSQGPNSTILSLVHEVGKNSSTVDSTVVNELTLEIMDPQGIFEETVLDNSVYGAWDIKDNSEAAYLEQQRNKLLAAYQGFAFYSPEARAMANDIRDPLTLTEAAPSFRYKIYI